MSVSINVGLCDGLTPFIQEDAKIAPYHGFAMREVSVNATSLHETN